MSFDVPKGNSPEFLDFLSKSYSTIPKGAQWAVVFHNLNSILPAIKLSVKNEPRADLWKIDEAANSLLTPDYQTRFGCMFAHALEVPGDNMSTAAEGIKTNGFIRSYVGTGRADFPILRISFLDTNISFSDSFLRGWTLATANYGLVARPPGDKNYRTNMTCYKFGITPKGPTVLQRMFFEKICCTSVTNEEYAYNPPTGYVKRDATFIYNNYSLDMVTNNSILKEQNK